MLRAPRAEDRQIVEQRTRRDARLEFVELQAFALGRDGETERRRDGETAGELVSENPSLKDERAIVQPPERTLPRGSRPTSHSRRTGKMHSLKLLATLPTERPAWPSVLPSKGGRSIPNALCLSSKKPPEGIAGVPLIHAQRA